jgi:type II secretory pathway pseudopilin PulG
MNNFIKRKKILNGITLIELLVSVSLFVIIVLSSTQIFVMVLQAQRRVVAIQNVQESLKYFFEVTSKEIRMARQNIIDENNCNSFSNNFLFDLEGTSTLYLRNQDNECVKYYLGSGENDGRFMIEREGVSVPLSPSEIIIDELSFELVNREDSNQAYVTINILAKSVSRENEEVEIRLQTTVASRFYRWQ